MAERKLKTSIKSWLCPVFDGIGFFEIAPVSFNVPAQTFMFNVVDGFMEVGKSFRYVSEFFIDDGCIEENESRRSLVGGLFESRERISRARRLSP